MTVSFDFDGTLSREDVQEYAKELIERGINVIVTTARFDDDNKHLYPVNATNDDLYEVTDRLGIKRENIHFLNMELKADFLKTTNAIWHLDDDDVETSAIMELDYPIVGIDVNDPRWKWFCYCKITGGNLIKNEL